MIRLRCSCFIYLHLRLLPHQCLLPRQIVTFRGEHGNGGIHEHLLENLDQYSDEEVNSLLTDLLAKEEASEK